MSFSRDESGTKANLFATLGPSGDGGHVRQGLQAQQHGRAFQPVRVVDDLGHVLRVLGRDTTLARLKAFAA